MKWKKQLWVLVYIKYGKFCSVSLELFIKHKPLSSEECTMCVYVVSRSHKSHEWGLHNQSKQQQSCCKRSAYSKYVYYYMVLVQCINISTCRFLSCTPNLYILRQLVQKKCTKGRSDLGLVVISLWNASKQGG